MRRFLLCLIAMVAMLNVSYAKDYHWLYNFSFEAPDGGRIAYNSRTQFEMVWDDMTFITKLCRNVGDNDELLKRDLQRTAAGYNMYDTRTDKFNNASFKGFILHGTLPDGSSADICNLQSKKSQLCVQLTINYTRDSEKDARKIIKSACESKSQKKKPVTKQKIQKKNAPLKPIKKPTTTTTELHEI